MAANVSVPVDFYGEPSYWFLIVTFIFGLDIFLSNLLLLWIAGSSKEIRSVSSNYFTMNLAVGNSLVGSFYAFLQPFVLYFGEDLPVLCKICGFGNITFAMSFLFTPTLIAASRYYNVTRLPSSSGNWFTSRAFFTKSGAFALLAAFWSYAVLFPLFLLLIDQLGEDPSGFCAARAFTSALLYVIYNMALIIFALVTAILTYIYFHRLSKFLVRHHRRSSITSSSIDTKNVMRLVAITAILPLVCNSPTLLLSGGQWFVPGMMPMWLKRTLVLPVFIPPMAGPWLTMLLLRPFKKRFNEKVARMWRISTVSSVEAQQANDFVRVLQRQSVHHTPVIVYDADGRRRSSLHRITSTLRVQPQ